MERRGKAKRFTLRLLNFFAGLVVLSLGIDLNTKTQLGISPINSVPFNVHQLMGLPLHARHGTHRKAHLRPYREAHLRPYREALRKSLLNIETTPKEKSFGVERLYHMTAAAVFTVGELRVIVGDVILIVVILDGGFDRFLRQNAAMELVRGQTVERVHDLLVRHGERFLDRFSLDHLRRH